MKNLIISVIIHFIILVVVDVTWFADEEDKAIAPKLDSRKTYLQVSIELDEVRKKKVISKVKKKVVPVKKKVINSRQNTLDKIEGENLRHRYIVELKSFIESRKYYPRKARRMRQTGIVSLEIEVDEQGNFRDIKVDKPSSYTSLNNAALNLVKSLSKFRPLPKKLGDKITVGIPIRYKLVNDAS